MVYRRRMMIFLACQSVMVVGMVVTLMSGYFGSFLPAWLLFTAMLSFLLGSYDRIDLTRNKRGQVRLTKTWRICFIAKAPQNVPLREYEGIQTGMADDTNYLDWALGFFLLPIGGIPGILWWLYVISADTFYVALTKDHGFPSMSLYRGFDRAKAYDIADTLQEVADMPCENTL
jgi:hypothetical protein